jgi:site-specific DNA recombinase
MNAIGYVRVSVKDQSTYSLDGQERAIRQYCATNDLQLLEVFKDDGESSYTFDRPDWKALERFIKANKSVTHLIIFDHDRFSRNLAEALIKIKELHDKFGVRVLATTDSFNTDFTDPSTFMIRAFKYMMAESELHKIRSRTQAGYIQACLKGHYVNKAPYGYINEKIGEAPSLSIDVEKAFAVKLIFNEYLAGSSIEEVRKLLKAHNFNLSGNSAIQRILTNPTYAGLIKVPQYRDRPETVVPGLHKAIVSEQSFYQAQQKLTGNKRISIHSNDEVPLKGVLKGPGGRLVSAGNSKSKSGKYFWYYVQQEDRKHLSAIKLHAQMGELLDTLSFSTQRIAYYEKIVGTEIQKHLMGRAEQVARTKKALRQVEDKIALAEEKWLLQPTSKAAYTKVMNALRSQHIELANRLRQLEEDGRIYWERLNAALPKLHDLRSCYEGMPLYRKHQFLNMVFDNSLRHDGTTYRTPYIHPIFEHNRLALKEKGLLVIEQPLGNLGETPVRTAYGSLFEHFFKLADLLAA